jgi:hypothetical protein
MERQLPFSPLENFYMILRIAVVLLITSAAGLSQHTLTLNSGTRIEGRYEGGNADNLTFIDQHGSRHKFSIAEVQSLIFNQPRAPEPSEYPERSYIDTDVEPDAGWRRGASIPAGTEIAVRTIDPIDVREPDPRRHFLAIVDSDVVGSNGDVLIPRGSEAHLIARKVSGGEIAIDLRSVNVRGARYILNSDDITNVSVRDGLGANKRTGGFVGGGALLGTVLGAVAGGGKGAAIGAIAGGAAGAGTQVLTRGSALHIPSETILRFHLDHPVYLYQ